MATIQESPFFPINPKYPEPKKPDDPSDPDGSKWKEKLERMKRGLPPTKPTITEEESKRIIRGSELRQLQEMKRVGIDKVEELPGEILGA